MRTSTPARISTCLVLAFGLLLLSGCGGGGDQGGYGSGRETTGGTTTTTDDAGDATTSSESGDLTSAADLPGEPIAGANPSTAEPVLDPDEAAVYFTAGEQFRPVERDVSDAADPVEAATEALIEGPTAAEDRKEVRSAIPEGTELRGVEVSDDGTAVVEVTGDFMAGVPRNPRRRDRDQSAVLNARLAQVAFTTTQFEGVDDAKVVAGGIAVEPASDRGDYRRPASDPPPVPARRGQRVPGTRSIQRKLARARYLPFSAIDGLFGYRTQQAVIAFQSWNGLARDGIVGPQTLAALRGASPPKPAASGPNRRIEVYRDRGVTLLIRRGEVRRAIHVSSGAPGYTTPAGRYEVFRKEEKSWSYPYSVWLPWASYFNNGIAFHEWADIPVYPASHGCVRVPVPEAQDLYRFARLGTPVFVY